MESGCIINYFEEFCCKNRELEQQTERDGTRFLSVCLF